MDGLSFVQQIENELKSRGISKEQFYRESGISSATFSQWRKNIYSPSSAAIKKIEAFLGISFSLEQKNISPGELIPTERESRILEALRAKTPAEQKALLTLLGIED